MAECEICAQKPRMNDDNPYFIAELSAGFAVLAWNQFFPGYTMFLGKRCAPELHELPPDERQAFLREMSIVAEAAYRAFSPRKMNYELLGNSVSHVHWHLIPRYEDDPNPRWPIWSNQAFRDAPPRTEIAPERLREMRDAVRRELAKLR
jgi:diadenosine tetraphosphate (Ap4A) HIT family hydrolase